MELLLDKDGGISASGYIHKGSYKIFIDCRGYYMHFSASATRNA